MTHPNENDKAEALDDFNKMVDFIHDIYPYHPNDFLMKRTIKTIRAALSPEPVDVDAEPAQMPEIIIAYTNSDRSKVSGSWVMKGVTFSLGDRPYSRYVRADLIPTAEPVRGDAEQFKDIMWAEKKVDVYSGDNCDEHKPFWWGYAEGDKQDGDIDDPLTLSLSQFPAGTKITISVPICPNCDLDRDFTNNTATPEMCECGFNWKGRDDEKYS